MSPPPVPFTKSPSFKNDSLETPQCKIDDDPKPLPFNSPATRKTPYPLPSNEPLYENEKDFDIKKKHSFTPKLEHEEEPKCFINRKMSRAESEKILDSNKGTGNMMIRVREKEDQWTHAVSIKESEGKFQHFLMKKVGDFYHINLTRHGHPELRSLNDVLKFFNTASRGKYRPVDFMASINYWSTVDSDYNETENILVEETDKKLGIKTLSSEALSLKNNSNHTNSSSDNIDQTPLSFIQPWNIEENSCSYNKVSRNVGVNGDIIKSSTYTITIPANALKKDTTITIETFRLKPGKMLNFQGEHFFPLARIVRCTPSKISFDKEITITCFTNYWSEGRDSPVQVFTSYNDKTWTIFKTIYLGRHPSVHFKTSHFSPYGIFDTLASIFVNFQTTIFHYCLLQKLNTNPLSAIWKLQQKEGDRKEQRAIEKDIWKLKDEFLFNDEFVLRRDSKVQLKLKDENNAINFKPSAFDLLDDKVKSLFFGQDTAALGLEMNINGSLDLENFDPDCFYQVRVDDGERGVKCNPWTYIPSACINGAFMKQKLAVQQNFPNDDADHDPRSSTNKRETHITVNAQNITMGGSSNLITEQAATANTLSLPSTSGLSNNPQLPSITNTNQPV